MLQIFDQSRKGSATPMQSPTDTPMTTPGAVTNDTDHEPSGCGLGLNVDVMVCRAGWYYHIGAYQVFYILNIHETPQILYRIRQILEALHDCSLLCQQAWTEQGILVSGECWLPLLVMACQRLPSDMKSPRFRCQYFKRCNAWYRMLACHHFWHFYKLQMLS